MIFKNGSHLGFQILSILAIFDLQVIPMLPTKFWVNWPFGSGEEMKKKKKQIQDGPHGAILDFQSEWF